MITGGQATMSFQELWESLLPVGRDSRTGGYRRLSWTPEDAACREWFTQAAAARGLRAHCDRNGNLWAWWDVPGEPGGAIVTGSHLDSVPDGGAYDGPLGIVSAFSAIDQLRAQGFAPARPIAVAAFCEEEGARFGVACLGSRLLTGAIDPGRAAELRDGDGVSFADAMAAAGLDPAAIGPDPDLLAGINAYVELHIEQGRHLAGLGAAIGVAKRIWPHGRWRVSFTGQADHAGTAVLSGRHDPMLPFAGLVLSARETAVLHRAVATVGKVIAEPGGVNAVPSRVTCWLDARAPDEPVLRAMADQVITAAQQAAGLHGVSLDVRQESMTPAVEFDPSLRDRVSAALAARGVKAPPLPTAAGHDAGVLAANIPTAMLFVRNPTGVSHAPAEHADAADCAAGAGALAAVLADLASGTGGADPGVPTGGPG
jgi:beta-ureidopropionase / N-carbamoyl-L-amino-acid hydrolase